MTDEPQLGGEHLIEGDAETRERIARDLHAIVAAVLLATPPKKLGKQGPARWHYNWLNACLWGYVQTDLGVPHASGEDASTWREDAARVGIDLSDVTGRTFAEGNRDREQKRLYAAMVSHHALGSARQRQP